MIAKDKPQLAMLVALMSEAKPLIDQFGLRPVQQGGMTLYRRAEQQYEISLLVTGIGRVPMATSVGWLAGVLGEARTAWLNVGTAGHAEMAVGEVVRIVHCDNVLSGRAHYVPLVVPWKGSIGSLVTADQATSDYPEASLVDMEGAAFFESCLRFAPAELVQSIKVVSDNRETDLTQINGETLTKLIGGATATIETFSTAMLDLCAKLPEVDVSPAELIESLSTSKISVTQRRQLGDLTRRLLNTGESLDDLIGTYAKNKNVSLILSDMRTRLESRAPVLNG